MKQWTDADRLVLVTERPDGTLAVATRPERDAVWGPPTVLALVETDLQHWRRRWEESSQ